MNWNTFRARRAERPKTRKSIALNLELLEDRTMPCGSGLEHAMSDGGSQETDTEHRSSTTSQSEHDESHHETQTREHSDSNQSSDESHDQAIENQQQNQSTGTTSNDKQSATLTNSTPAPTPASTATTPAAPTINNSAAGITGAATTPTTPQQVVPQTLTDSLSTGTAAISAPVAGAQAKSSSSDAAAKAAADQTPFDSSSTGTTTPGTTDSGSQGTTSTVASTGQQQSSSSTLADPTLVSLTINPLDVNLLGLEVKTDQIQVNISAQPGSGELLGNLLTSAANLVNLQGVNNALNNVLGNVVTLLNSASLNVSGVNSAGPLASAQAATTPVLDLYVAPVHLSLLGANDDTSPIHVMITAHSGQGLVLGNVLTDLANLFNPPLPAKLNLDTINARLTQLINELNAQIPGIGTTSTGATTTSSGQVLSLTVPPINLNLLGLQLKTSQIQVNASAQSGNGDLLGNILTSLLNTLGATPQNLSTLNSNLNTLLSKVVAVLNASSLTLSSTALSSLSPALQSLALPNLVNTTGTASAPILNLAIASTNGTSPPVNVNLLGLQVTTSNIQAQLIAQTGTGQILGNLLYNASHLLDPGGSLSLLSILNELGL